VRQEFCNDEIHRWFVAADLDGNGTLSIDEYFKWSLSKSSTFHGEKAILGMFRQYDKDGSGLLDAVEFEKVCRDVGFGDVARDIFLALDHDHSGTIAYQEFVASLKDEKVQDVDAKRMLATIVQTYGVETSRPAGQQRPAIDTTAWVIRGSDSSTVQKEMQALLQSSGGYVTDIIKLFDEDVTAKLTIDDVDFFKTMRSKFGFGGPKHVLDEVFRALDEDGDGSIGFDELYEFVRGTKHSLDSRRHIHARKSSMSLEVDPQPDRHTGKLIFPSLHDVIWSPEVLRCLIKQMLARCRLSPVDLLRAWDIDDRNGYINTNEFLRGVRRLLKGPDLQLWENEVKDTTVLAFDEILRNFSGDTKGGRAERFFGIVRLVQWIERDATSPSLPLKRKRNRKLRADVPDQGNGRLDLVSKTKREIAAAAAKAARIKSGDEDRQLRQPTKAKVPLQRWEIPDHVEPLGLRWKSLGTTRPMRGEEVENAPLAAALLNKHDTRQELTLELDELLRFKTNDLRKNAFVSIAVGKFDSNNKHYFKLMVPFDVNGADAGGHHRPYRCHAMHKVAEPQRINVASMNHGSPSLPAMHLRPVDTRLEHRIHAGRLSPMIDFDCVDILARRLVEHQKKQTVAAARSSPQPHRAPMALPRVSSVGSMAESVALARNPSRAGGKWISQHDQELSRPEPPKFGSSSIRVYSLPSL